MKKENKQYKFKIKINNVSVHAVVSLAMPANDFDAISHLQWARIGNGDPHGPKQRKIGFKRQERSNMAHYPFTYDSVSMEYMEYIIYIIPRYTVYIYILYIPILFGAIASATYNKKNTIREKSLPDDKQR